MPYHARDARAPRREVHGLRGGRHGDLDDHERGVGCGEVLAAMSVVMSVERERKHTFYTLQAIFAPTAALVMSSWRRCIAKP